MIVVAKMQVRSVEDWGYSRKITLSCQYDSKINQDTPENRGLTKATPSGECWMSVDNKNVWPHFRNYRMADPEQGIEHEPATEHYVLFIDASKNSLADVMAAVSHLE